MLYFIDQGGSVLVVRRLNGALVVNIVLATSGVNFLTRQRTRLDRAGNDTSNVVVLVSVSRGGSAIDLRRLLVGHLHRSANACAHAFDASATHTTGRLHVLVLRGGDLIATTSWYRVRTLVNVTSGLLRHSTITNCTCACDEQGFVTTTSFTGLVWGRRLVFRRVRCNER